MLVDAAVDAVAAQTLGELPDAVHEILTVVAVADEEAQRHAGRMITQFGGPSNCNNEEWGETRRGCDSRRKGGAARSPFRELRLLSGYLRGGSWLP